LPAVLMLVVDAR